MENDTPDHSIRSSHHLSISTWVWQFYFSHLLFQTLLSLWDTYYQPHKIGLPWWLNNTYYPFGIYVQTDQAYLSQSFASIDFWVGFFGDSLCYLFFLASLLLWDVVNNAFRMPQVFVPLPFAVFISQKRIRTHWIHKHEGCDVLWRQWSHYFCIPFQNQQEHRRRSNFL